jgi:AAT family amino acid transporter
MAVSVKPVRLQLGAIPFALSTFLIIQVGSFLVWELFADPKHGFWKFYPQPFGVYLFWGILVLVFLGFNCGMSGFAGLGQPKCGLASTALTVVLSFVIPALLIHGYGKMDPAFSSAGNAGHGAAGLIVLIGFYGFGILATGMGGWPWSDAGLEQPIAGITQIFTGLSLTVVGYVLLIYPNVASWSTPDRVLLSLPTSIGWFYSVIVAWLTTFLILDNWPWSVFRSRAGVALAAFFGNFLLGTLIYYAFLAMLEGFLIPADALAKIAASINLWPAQLGVWIAFWLIFWPNVAGNFPTSLSPPANRLIRFAVTWGLGTLSFSFYMHWFAVKVLNEAEIVPGFGGDPLTWVDLLNYVMLIYVVYFGFYPITKRE